MPTDVWRNLAPAKRERVLAAASAEFGRVGFSRGSLNTIAREADVAKGSLFQYFDNKLDLFATVGDEAARRVRAAMAPRLRELSASLPTLAEALVEALVEWVRWFAAHPVERGVVTATNLEMDGEVRRAVRGVAHRHYLEVLRPWVARAAAEGQLAPHADEDAVLAWLLLLVPHLAMAPFVPELDPVLGLHGADEETVRAAVRRMVAVLLPPPGM
ncbi:transcriptional regulator, TetR family [Streptoalloteichus tenebrarius]|uniref:Transcriptional regulator, TetR family n=1 Tax=Streptoalloteichus tenebrarius (strain ATCC 17920 / DSM 40477 / JCM 4838 / CBS 697.72 / NBRC 16177 / NCIMB 11028 / NRRL B-12390 / A12253. 1 / ISP 5477) TaxID=1933 RepID=A0ABT1HN00_STRSD|nr:TetR/AcrR family transcriptional regulator [Streptoalloteichus tenebrarius]MCP2256892.1 transcriptional regulator, TetR family [Streptoalloteichus tenebrarius]BFF00200.1 TetR/AcrR family transcriptional regulator [Streptoalloteichus tenebrarius]